MSRIADVGEELATGGMPSGAAIRLSGHLLGRHVLGQEYILDCQPPGYLNGRFPILSFRPDFCTPRRYAWQHLTLVHWLFAISFGVPSLPACTACIDSRGGWPLVGDYLVVAH